MTIVNRSDKIQPTKSFDHKTRNSEVRVADLPLIQISSESFRFFS